MYTQKITYTDYNGITHTEDFYFNISAAELASQELESNGTYLEALKVIGESQDGAVVVPEFKKIIRWAYGVKAEDGKRFIKSKELTDAFEQSEAYSVFFVQLMTDPEVNTAFANGIIPDQINGQSVKNASEAARTRSEASLQGHKAAAQREIPTVVEAPPLPSDIPAEELTASVVAPPETLAEEARPVVVEGVANTASHRMTDEEYAEYLALKDNQGSKVNPDLA